MTERMKNQEIADALYNYGAFYLEGGYSTGGLHRIESGDFAKLIDSMQSDSYSITNVQNLVDILESANVWFYSDQRDGMTILYFNKEQLELIESIFETGSLILNIDPKQKDILDKAVLWHKNYYQEQSNKGGKK